MLKQEKKILKLTEWKAAGFHLHLFQSQYFTKALGPSRVAQFQYNEPNPDLQADVAGYIRELLDKCPKAGS